MASPGMEGAALDAGAHEAPLQDRGPLPELTPAAAAAPPPEQPASLVVNSKESFQQVWESFMAHKGQDTRVPLFNKHEIDLFKLFKLVLKQGGCDAVTASKKWAWVGRQFNPPASMTDLSFQMKKIYTSKLKALEDAHTAGQLGVQLAVDLPATPLAPPAPPKPKASSAKPPRPAKAPKKKAFGEEEEEEEGGAGPDQEDALPQEPRALRQRKRTLPAAAAAPGAELVGRRIGIYWPDGNQHYWGSVEAYSEEEGTHQVAYDDGEVEQVDLEMEDWVLEEGQQGQQEAAQHAQQAQREAAAEEAEGGQPAKKPRGAAEQAAPAAAPAPAGVSEPPLLPRPPPGAPAGLLGAGAFPPTTTMVCMADLNPTLAAAQHLAQPVPAFAPPPQLSMPATGMVPLPGGPAAGMAAALGMPANGLSAPRPGLAAAPTFGGGGPAIPLPPGMQPRPRQSEGSEATMQALQMRAGLGQALVANGPGYRAFTTTTGPPGFEVFCLLQGVRIEDVHVRCWSNGRVLIKTEPPKHSHMAPYQQLVQLPARLDTQSAQAMFAADGHLYVRVNRKGQS